MKNGNGVLIRSVEKGSRGDKAGFRAGDVIVKVNDQTVHDTSDFTHALRSGKGGSMNVNVIRDKKEQSLTLTLPERKESGEMLFDEESFDDTPIEAEADEIASDVADLYAQVRPQVALALQDARKAAEDARQAAKEYRTELCNQQKQMREQMRELRKEMESNVHKQLREQRQLKKEMEHLRVEMHSFDI